jgi:inhibitor of KinA
LMPFLSPRLRPMGDAALLVELGDAMDESLNARVHALAFAVDQVAGVVEVVPAYASLLVEFDPARLTYATLREQVTRALERESSANAAVRVPRVIEIPTRYGGEFGPDLEFVARHNSLTPEAVIRLHTAQPLRVFMLGFTPGFPYLGILPPQIAAPRLATPRARVPAGSVGIAGRQTGIYPRESPGGWRLIGRTAVQLFDPAQNPPALLRPGDYVRFVQVDKETR